MKENHIIYLALIFIFSCSEHKKEVNPDVNSLNPLPIKVKENIFPTDSLQVIHHVHIKKPTVIHAGNPTITPAFTNISPAGNPVIEKAKVPNKFTPGINSNKFPETTPVKISKVAAVNRRLKKARYPAIIDGVNNTFEYLDIEQGLASGNILNIFQDKKGNIWLGTNGEGIIKYDGVNFLQFTDKDGIPNNWVRCMLEDRNGNMWFGTDGGIVKYDGSDFYWITDQPAGNGRSAKMDTRSMAEDKTGNIWVGTANLGLFKFDGKSFTSYPVAKEAGSYISDIELDKNGKLWFGGPNLGACYYDGQSFLQFTQSHGLVNNHVNCITEDAAGKMWFGTENGVSEFDGSTFSNLTEKEGLCNKNINSIAQDRAGNLWFGTNDNGCCMYNGKSISRFNLAEGLRNNYVGSILVDNAGNLLFGTRGGGVLILRQNNFLNFGRQSIINQTNITSINEDNEGNTWFGTFNGKIIKYDGLNFFQYTINPGFDGGPVGSIMKDKEGCMWFGGLRGGLCKFDGTYFYQYSGTQNALLTQVTELHQDKNGAIWIGTNTNKILKFYKDSISGFSLFNPQKKGVIWSIFEDIKGNIWIGTHDGLLGKYDGKSILYYHFKNNPLYNLQQDSDGNIWVASSADGLLKFDAQVNERNGKDKVFMYFNKISDQYNLRINSLLKDRKENLWIGTNKGLVLFENPSGKPGKATRMLNITEKDGLPGEAFVRRSVFVDTKDRIWWGTTKGVSMLDLDKMQLDTFTPAIQLSHIIINEKFTDFHHCTDSVYKANLPSDFQKIKYSGVEKFFNFPINPQIPYSLNHLNFNFIAMDWASPQRLKYSYKMDGFDDEWSELSEDAHADYRNIPYGKYIFKVKAIGAAQKWSKVFEYPFIIQPPWWHSLWFRTLMAAGLFLSIFLFTRLRTRALLERQKYLQITVEKRTEQLRIALTEKEALLKEIHHRVKNNLEVISSLLMLQTNTMTDEKGKAALIEGQNRVQSIALIHQKLYRSEDLGSVELTGFAKDLFKQVKDVFNKTGTMVECRVNEREIWLSTDTAVPFGLILNELITNAFKYAVQSNRENILSLFAEEIQAGETTDYHFIFRDNGPGLPADLNAESANSLGMKVIRLLTKQLDGHSKFYNDNGTVFELQFSKRNIKL